MNLKTDNILLDIYRRLYQDYGPQGWWPGDGPLDVVIGAILTQSAAWSNVEMALQNLKVADCWSLGALNHWPEADLASIIRPCGFFNSKARKLKAFAAHVYSNYQGNLSQFLGQELQQLRDELLSIHGIGPETADDILVYAAGIPSFVIDVYTKRILHRMGLAQGINDKDYYAFQSLLHEALPRDVIIFNEYHALLDEHAKKTCTKIPQCSACCLRDLCMTGQQAMLQTPRPRLN